jgi:hypothetical protein
MLPILNILYFDSKKFTLKEKSFLFQQKKRKTSMMFTEEK